MVNICCRLCGRKLEIMAICIKCGKEILYGCPRCVIFSDTMLHINCLDSISVVYGKYGWLFLVLIKWRRKILKAGNKDEDSTYSKWLIGKHVWWRRFQIFSQPAIHYEDKVVKSLLATSNFFFFRVFFSTISNVTYHIASLVLHI